RRAARKLGALAEELHLDTRATDVAVAKEADNSVGAQCLHQGGARLRPEWDRVEAQVVTDPVEPFVELGRLEALDDGRARHPPGQPRTGEIPVAGVGHDDDDAAALLTRLVHILDAVEDDAVVDAA